MRVFTSKIRFYGSIAMAIGVALSVAVYWIFQSEVSQLFRLAAIQMLVIIFLLATRFYIKDTHWRIWILLVLIGVVTGVLRLGVAAVPFSESDFTDILNDESEVVIDVEVQVLDAKETSWGWSVRFDQLRLDNEWIDQGGIVFCETQLNYVRFEKVRFYGVQKLDLHEFHGNKYLRFECTENFKQTTSPQMITKILYLRNSFLTNVREKFLEPQASLIYGLLIGKSSSFSSKLSENLRMSGTTHIVAVSGYNVMLLFVVVKVLFSRIGRRILVLSVFLFGAFYVFFSGFTPPVIRAVIMTLISVLLFEVGKPAQGINILLVTLVSMFFLDPSMFGSVSFQLSFAALVGIILIPEYMNLSGKSKLSIISEGFVTTLFAFVSTLPLILFYFGGAPVVALVSNVIILPLVSILTVLSAIIVPLVLALPVFDGLFVFVLDSLARVIVGLIVFFGERFDFLYINIEINVWITVMLYVLLGSVLLYIRRIRMPSKEWVL